MIIDIETARSVDANITREDILALEKSIIELSNNHFHTAGYYVNVVGIEGNKIHIDGDNLFKVNDTIEVVGIQCVDGLHHVREVGTNYIVLHTDIRMPYTFMGSGMLYLVDFPADVKSGIKKIIEYKAKVSKNLGVKSRSVSRVSESYFNTADTSSTINGVPAYLYDFLQPYQKMRW